MSIEQWLRFGEPVASSLRNTSNRLTGIALIDLCRRHSTKYATVSASSSLRPCPVAQAIRFATQLAIQVHTKHEVIPYDVRPIRKASIERSPLSAAHQASLRSNGFLVVSTSRQCETTVQMACAPLARLVKLTRLEFSVRQFRVPGPHIFPFSTVTSHSSL